MFLCYGPIALAAAFLQADVVVEVPVHNMRPSKLVAQLPLKHSQTPQALQVTVTPLDERGTIRLFGDQEDVAVLKRSIEMMDVRPKDLRLRIQVESPLDKVDYDVIAHLRNNQMWKMTDGDTGVTVGVQPRLDDAGILTIMLQLGDAVNGQTSMIRLKPGETAKVQLSNQRKAAYVELPDGSVLKSEQVLPGSIVRLTYEKEWRPRSTPQPRQ